MIEKKLELTQLFDFYGELLTEKQQEVLNLFLIEDYGHVEIGETMAISRQAVYDTIKTCDRQLHEFEQKLGLVAKHLERRTKLEHLLHQLKAAESTAEAQGQREALAQTVAEVEEILAL